MERVLYDAWRGVAWCGVALSRAQLRPGKKQTYCCEPKPKDVPVCVRLYGLQKPGENIKQWLVVADEAEQMLYCFLILTVRHTSVLAAVNSA